MKLQSPNDPPGKEKHTDQRKEISLGSNGCSMSIALAHAGQVRMEWDRIVPPRSY